MVGDCPRTLTAVAFTAGAATGSVKLPRTLPPVVVVMDAVTTTAPVAEAGTASVAVAPEREGVIVAGPVTLHDVVPFAPGGVVVTDSVWDVPAVMVGDGAFTATAVAFTTALTGTVTLPCTTSEAVARDAVTATDPAAPACSVAVEPSPVRVIVPGPTTLHVIVPLTPGGSTVADID